METSDILRREHRWIRLMLTCLERLVAGARERGRFDPEGTAELLCLLDEFADGEHQRKEEEALLPLLLTRTSSDDEAHIAVLSRDHFEERELLAALRELLGAAARGEDQPLERIARETTDYVDLQRRHMQREEAVLLPMIERVLTPDDDARVVEAFGHVETTGIHMAGVVERVTALCHRLDVPL